MHKIQKPIGDFVSQSKPTIVSGDETVLSATAQMRDHGTGCVLVEHTGQLSGIFTERDLLNRVVAPGLPLDVTPVRAVMTASPEVLHSDDYVTYAINRMSVGGYRHIPVVGYDGRAVGVLSVRDVINHLVEVFEEADLLGDDDSDEDDWTDLGGGG